MRIHTNVLTREQVTNSLQVEKRAGRIANTVTFKMSVEHKSHSHARAFEIQLESWDKEDGDGRRVGNSGSYGAMQGNGYAATYDEWGWLLAALYAIDPYMVCGNVKHPTYRDADDFHENTGLSYDPMQLIEEIKLYGDPYPYYTGAHSGFVGRIGANRLSVHSPQMRYSDRARIQAVDWYRAGNDTMKRGLWIRYAPRNVADVERFARIGKYAPWKEPINDRADVTSGNGYSRYDQPEVDPDDQPNTYAEALTRINS